MWLTYRKYPPAPVRCFASCASTTATARQITPPITYAIGAVSLAKLTMNANPSSTFSPGAMCVMPWMITPEQTERTCLQLGLGDLSARGRSRPAYTSTSFRTRHHSTS